MRAILRKISKEAELTTREHKELLQYVDSLRQDSPESYAIFYDKYASSLYLNYHTLIPKYTWDMDSLVNYLIEHPGLVTTNRSIPISEFPLDARPYLIDTFGPEYAVIPAYITNILNTETSPNLPRNRVEDIKIKYEEANPYKEVGLKQHFDRLAKYSFISRLQTYRYLTRNKAAFDRFELVSPDSLGGIFTNKDKSIYYYLFLTESDLSKAQNACKLLNYTFYNRTDGE